MNGVLGKVVTTANQFVPVYTVPATADFATVSIYGCNKGTVDSKIRIAITTQGTPGPADFIEYDPVLAANGGTIERTCMIVDVNETVMVYADSANVVFRVAGLEEPAVA